MTDRERFVRCVTGRGADRPPLWLTPPPDTVLDRWRQEGAGAADWPAVCERFGCDLPPQSIPVLCSPWPNPNQPEHEDGQAVVHMDHWGARHFHFPNHAFRSRYADFPVKSPRDWERYKELLLRAEEPGRFDPQWQAAVQQCVDHGQPISFGDWRELGLLDPVAFMVGPDACLGALESARPMVVDMVDHISRLYVAILQQIVDAGVHVDMIRLSDYGEFPHVEVGEFRRLCEAPLTRIVDFARGREIPILAYEEPAFEEQLPPVLTAMGINCLLGGRDAQIGSLREEFPLLGLTGGIRLADLKGGRDSIDACLSRVREWVAAGRYIPEIECIPDMPWEDFEYLALGLRDVLGVSQPLP